MYLYGKKLKPTPAMILEVLPSDRAKKAVEEVGGLEYLMGFDRVRVKSENIVMYIEKIRQAHTRREIIRICEETTKKMEDDSANVLNPAELISVVDKKLTDINVGSALSSDVYKIGDDTDRILAERAETPNAIPGLEVGFPKFDRITNGGQPGDLIFVAARAKTGKSVSLTNWAVKLGLIDKLPILYIDTEMDSRENEDRIIALLTGIPHSEIVSGLYMLDTEYGTSEEKLDKIAEAKQIMKDGNLYHIYMPGFTLEKVVAITRQFQMQHGIVALFFDYLKFPASEMATLKTVQEWQMLGFLASGLKDLAGILKIPVYSAVQENRSGIDTQRKNAGNIAGSDRILQLATKLIFLYNKDPEEIAKHGPDAGNQWLYIAFQRNGESDVDPIPLRFYKNILRQVEV
jgi:replicative DNA helicase